MHKPGLAARRRVGGFTLIELMVVVVVVGILASVAYPSYRNQVRSTRRAEGKTVLLETAQRLERCYTRFNAYNNVGCEVTLPRTTASGYYVISAGALNVSSFALRATPAGAQATDTKCGTLTYTSGGVQGSLGATTDANKCW